MDKYWEHGTLDLGLDADLDLHCAFDSCEDFLDLVTDASTLSIPNSLDEISVCDLETPEPKKERPRNSYIGTLTYQERRAKIKKFLQKRKFRKWTKKINYDCRKKVADSRLRVKGRFVSKEKAKELLASTSNQL